MFPFQETIVRPYGEVPCALMPLIIIGTSGHLEARNSFSSNVCGDLQPGDSSIGPLLAHYMGSWVP